MVSGEAEDKILIKQATLKAEHKFVTHDETATVPPVAVFPKAAINVARALKEVNEMYLIFIFAISECLTRALDSVGML